MIEKDGAKVMPVIHQLFKRVLIVQRDQALIGPNGQWVYSCRGGSFERHWTKKI